MALFLGLLGILLIIGGFLGLATLPGIAGIQSGIAFLAGIALFAAGIIVERLQRAIKELRDVRGAIENLPVRGRSAPPPPHPLGSTTSVNGTPLRPIHNEAQP